MSDTPAVDKGNGDLADRAAVLDAKLADHPVDEQIERLVQTGRTNRRLIKWLGVIVALSILAVCSVALQGFALRRAVRDTRVLAEAVKINSENVHVACLVRNAGRAQQIALWNKVLGIFFPASQLKGLKPDELFAVAGQVHALQAYLAEHYAPQPCPPALAPLDSGGKS